MKYVISRWFLFVITLFISLSSLANYPDVPKPFRYVTDYTRTLNQDQWQSLETMLTHYGEQTSSQIAVVIIPTTESEEISSYAHNLFDKWGIGRKTQNNGVLLLIAKQDRKLFIATGRGLEGALPDAIAASIIRHDITPFFKQEQYAKGIKNGLNAIIAATKGEYAPLETAEEEDTADIGKTIFFTVAIIIFILFKILGGSENIYISPSSISTHSTTQYRRSSGGGFGGGFSGSSRRGSGGGGFGGGSTGGGGAGGSW